MQRAAGGLCNSALLARLAPEQSEEGLGWPSKWPWSGGGGDPEAGKAVQQGAVSGPTCWGLAMTTRWGCPDRPPHHPSSSRSFRLQVGEPQPLFPHRWTGQHMPRGGGRVQGVDRCEESAWSLGDSEFSALSLLVPFYGHDVRLHGSLATSMTSSWASLLGIHIFPGPRQDLLTPTLCNFFN